MAGSGSSIEIDFSVRRDPGFLNISDYRPKGQESCDWYQWKVVALGSTLFHTITTVWLGVLALVANLFRLFGIEPRSINTGLYNSCSGLGFAIKELFKCSP